MLKNIIIVYLILSTAAYGSDSYTDLFEDMEDDTSISEDGENSPLSISGEHKFELISPYENSEYLEKPNFYNTFNIKYTVEDIEVFSSWEIIIPQNKLIPGENYIKKDFDLVSLKAGYNLFSWGHADELNPTNTLNSLDYSSLLDIKKIPELSLVMDFYYSDFNFTGVFIPMKNDSVLPIDPITLIPSTLAINKEIEELEGWDKMVLGGIINYYGAIDISLSYTRDLDESFYPDLVLNPSFVPGVDKPLLEELTLQNQIVHNIGLSGKSIIDRFGFWIEANYSLTEKTADYLEWTVGMDFNFGNEDQGFFNLQNFGKFVPQYKETPKPEDITTYTSINDFAYDLVINELQNIESEHYWGLTANISYSLFNGEVTPEFVGMYKRESDYNTFLLSPVIKFEPLDSFKFLLGAIWVYSDGDNTLYNQLEKRNSITMSVEYSW